MIAQPAMEKVVSTRRVMHAAGQIHNDLCDQQYFKVRMNHNFPAPKHMTFFEALSRFKKTIDEISDDMFKRPEDSA